MIVFSTFLFNFVLLLRTTFEFQCDRTPDGVLRPRTHSDFDKYQIEISGNPDSYVPGETYTIALKLNALITSKTIGGNGPNNAVSRSSFKDFILAVEPEIVISSDEVYGFQSVSATGSFQLLDDTLTKFSVNCPNTVIQTNSLPKREVQVLWKAPPKRSGCVLIKGTVLESRFTWYSDDGALTKKLCEEMSINENVQPSVLRHCCACDEAKYEIAFEGMWTRNTHPKCFPDNVFTTKFSEMIGASHRRQHSFWNYNHYASEGLRLLAETGSTRVLETELKSQNQNIRTIIKARELTYPNITGRTYTVLRVDNQNHLISAVSKIVPSPDWIVGVANLELCLKNCSWIDYLVLNLYPWDVGTDDGLSYISTDQPSITRQPIRRITSNSPNDPRSPFYDDNGEEMKPLARLHFTKLRLYAKSCDDIEPLKDDLDLDEQIDEEHCKVTEWSVWSPCSPSCMMFRQRSYIKIHVAQNCGVQLVQEHSCPCSGNGGTMSELDQRCSLTGWSNWSSCSVTCGKGTKTRDRQFVYKQYASVCSASNDVVLQENTECESTDHICGFESSPEVPEGRCQNTMWDDWSPCNVTCGTGIKIRYRTHVGDDENEFIENDEICANLKHMEMVECYQSPCDYELINNVSSNGEFVSMANTNNNNPMMALLRNDKIDCKLSKWSMWSQCNATESCSKGFKFKERFIRVQPQQGGAPCPKKLIKKKRCRAQCHENASDLADEEDSKETLPSWGPPEPTVDCEMSSWSAWSPCSTICGSSAVQQRTRSIVIHPKGNGAPCGRRKDEKRCPIPITCTEKFHF